MRRAAARVVRVPATPVIAATDRALPNVFMVLLRVEDDEGMAGYGCLWSLDDRETPLLVESLRFLSPIVVSDSRLSIAEYNRRMLKQIGFLGFKGVTVFGLSAFDMALHDLLCRRLGISLGALLGKRRTTTPAYWSGLYAGASAAELETEVELQLTRGFRAFKMRVGHADADVDLERVAFVSSLLPGDGTVAVDAFQAWTVDEALAMAARLQAHQPVWLEDPLVHNDYSGLRALVEQSPVPIATGENEYLPAGFEHVLDAKPAYLVPDLQRAGGISGWLQLADTTSSRGGIISPHVYPHIALQLVSTLGYETTLEYVTWWDPLTTYVPHIEDGRVEIPDVVGTGLDLAPDAVEHFAISDWIDL